jgi:hypothetical protein
MYYDVFPFSDRMFQCLGVFTPQNDAQIAVVSCTAPRGARIDWDVVLGDNLSVRLSGTNL